METARNYCWLNLSLRQSSKIGLNMGLEIFGFLIDRRMALQNYSFKARFRKFGDFDFGWG